MSKKIYTKTGDQGMTSLLGGTKVPKNDWRLESYGTVDELNSYLGLIFRKMDEQNRIFYYKLNELNEIQNDLFKIGSILSYDHSSNLKITLPNIVESDITKLETWIDKMEAVLTPLTNFIIPGGSEISSLCHIARTICRRAERNTISAVEYPLILKYLNRLSDYLFVLARFSNNSSGFNDKIWKS